MTDNVDGVLPPAVLDAGDFGEWLARIVNSFRGRGGMDVPCGSCRACCRSSYLIHVRSDEVHTLKALPAGLLMPTPGARTGGNVIDIGRDGVCPMLSSSTCSIYADRPQTCRDYDCRIFAAAGMEAGGRDKAAVNRQVAAWRFRYRSDIDRRVHRAIGAAATFLKTCRASFPGGRAPTAPTDIAVLAIKVHHVFLDDSALTMPTTDIARSIIEESLAFDEGRLVSFSASQDARRSSA